MENLTLTTFESIVNIWGGPDFDVQNGTERIEGNIGDCIIYSFIPNINNAMLGMKKGIRTFGGVSKSGDFGILYKTCEEAINSATAINNSSILELAKQIKASEKEQKSIIEQERFEKVIMLCDTIESLKPQESESIIKELKAISKASDFIQYHILTIAGTLNSVFYDGLKVYVFKQNGEISVKSLPKNVFIDVFKIDLANYFKKGVLSSEYLETETGYSLTAKECFEIWNQNQIDKTKGSKDFDTNLGTIYKRELEIKGLKAINKSLPKPYAKVKGKK